MSFHGLIAHFFLALNSISLYRCIIVDLHIHLLKDMLVAFKFWQLRVKLCTDFCVDVGFLLLWIKHQGAQLLRLVFWILVILIGV